MIWPFRRENAAVWTASLRPARPRSVRCGVVTSRDTPRTTYPVLAIDIGGTKIAVGLVADDGTVLHQTVQPTADSTDPETVFVPCATAIRAVLSVAAEAGLSLTDLDVGIGSAGPIDAPGGTISPVNIAAWRTYPIVARVNDVVSGVVSGAVRIRLAGDGHCIALGEHWLGAGRSVDTMIGMVLSTGVGGGAVVDNQLFAGRTGNAVHIGHTSVDAFGERCVCGAIGCVEQYARGPRMVQNAKARGWTGGDDAKALTADARAGDATALAVIDDAMRYLAAGIAACAIYLDITYVVLGGGVSKAGAVIFEPLRRHLADFTTLPYVGDLQVVPAELENAGLLGAASFALSLSGRGPLRAADTEIVG